LPITAPSGHGFVLPERAALAAISLPKIVLIVLLSVLCETAIVDQFYQPVGYTMPCDDFGSESLLTAENEVKSIVMLINFIMSFIINTYLKFIHIFIAIAIC